MTDQLRGARQHLRVPNNFLGRLFVRILRHYLNTESYKLTLRGRGVRKSCRKLYPRWRGWHDEVTGEWKREKVPGYSYPDPLPMRHSNIIGVYVDAREPFCKEHHRVACSWCEKKEWEARLAEDKAERTKWIAEGMVQERERRARTDDAIAEVNAEPKRFGPPFTPVTAAFRAAK